MKTIRIFAIAVAAVAVFACKSPSAHDKLVAQVENDKEVKALKPSSALMDSISYYLGVDFGLNLQARWMDKFEDMDMEMFKKGLKEAFGAGYPETQGDSLWAAKFSVNPWDAAAKVAPYQQQRRAYKALFDKKMFIYEHNAKETESGLLYALKAEGEGEKVTPEDVVTISYKGSLTNGTVFDQNDSCQLPAGGFVPGFVEGLCLMGKGGKVTLYIPSELGYGARPPYGSGIAPNSDLIFEVEVLDVQKPVVEEVAE